MLLHFRRGYKFTKLRYLQKKIRIIVPLVQYLGRQLDVKRMNDCLVPLGTIYTVPKGTE